MVHRVLSDIVQTRVVAPLISQTAIPELIPNPAALHPIKLVHPSCGTRMKIPNNILDGVCILFCKANEMIVVGEHKLKKMKL